ISFDVFRKLDLSFLGETWKECFIEFRYITVAEAKSFSSFTLNKDDPKSVENALDTSIKILEDKFVSGKALQDGKLVDLKKEDLKDLPVEVLNRSIIILTGGDEVKKNP